MLLGSTAAPASDSECGLTWRNAHLPNTDPPLCLNVSIASPSQAFNGYSELTRLLELSDYTEPSNDCSMTPIGQNCSSRLELKKPPTYSACFWDYVCDFDRSRIPQHLCQAECRQGCFNCNGDQQCSKVYSIVPILKTNTPDDCISDQPRFTWSQQRVAVACTCLPPEESCPIE